jgi:type IV pilus assembly protein PilC
VTFTRQFATMIDAGLPLVQCLEILGSQTDNKTFGQIIGKVRSDVEQGSTFAEALRKHPKAYPDLYVNMVAAGEAGGILDTILNRLAAYIEKTMALKKKVKSAMVYPGVTVTVAVAVVFLMLIFVIPTFEKMFKDFGGTLPAVTQSVIDMSKFLQSYWWVIIGGLIGLVVGSQRYRASATGQRQTDAMALKLPRSASSCARSPSPSSPGPSGRSSPAACRFSTASRSWHAPPATRSSRRPSSRPARRSPRARRSPSRWRRPRSSRRWWSR